jgi:hypothetical protein
VNRIDGREIRGDTNFTDSTCRGDPSKNLLDKKPCNGNVQGDERDQPSKLNPNGFRRSSRTVKIIVLAVWFTAVAKFVAAAPPPPSPTANVTRRSEVVASVTASNVTAQGVGKAPKQVDKQRTDALRTSFSTEEIASIARIVREYRPAGLITTKALVQQGPLPDMAVVRLTTRRGDRDELVCVLTLKKEGKEWKVESCAR